MLFEEKVLVTTKNDIGFAGTYSVIADYVGIKQSDKSGVIIFVKLSNITSVINLRGEELLLKEINEERINFKCFDSQEHIIKIEGNITYSGIDTECECTELNDLTDNCELMCINQELRIFVIIPKDEILREWKYT